MRRKSTINCWVLASCTKGSLKKVLLKGRGSSSWRYGWRTWLKGLVHEGRTLFSGHSAGTLKVCFQSENTMWSISSDPRGVAHLRTNFSHKNVQLFCYLWILLRMYPYDLADLCEILIFETKGKKHMVLKTQWEILMLLEENLKIYRLNTEHI